MDQVIVSHGEECICFKTSDDRAFIRDALEIMHASVRGEEIEKGRIDKGRIDPQSVPDGFNMNVSKEINGEEVHLIISKMNGLLCTKIYKEVPLDVSCEQVCTFAADAVALLFRLQK